MERARARRGLLGIVALIGASAIALAGCTSTTEPEPSPSPSPAANQEAIAYSGPAVFVGDELDAFLLTADEITSLLPGVTEVEAPVAGTEMYADGGENVYDPEACVALYLEPQLRSVGARTVSWHTDADGERPAGALQVLQFGSVAQAEERMDQLLAASESCAAFEGDGPGTFTDVTTDEREDARAFTGILRSQLSGIDWNAFYGYSQVGNVMVQLVQGFDGDQAFASDQIAAALADRAEEARTGLIEKLTAEPPVATDPVEVGGDVALADWPVAFSAVGPIVLGEAAQAAAEAVPGGQVTQSALAPGQIDVTLADGASRLHLRVDGGGAVTAIEVGATAYWESEGQDGASLPAAEGVRVGDPLSKAVAAFPEGSSMRVISADIDTYIIADRDGQAIVFSAARSDDPASTPIYSILVEDASGWTYMKG